MQLLDELAQATLGRGAAERLSYTAAFRRAIGVDPLQCTVAELADAAHRHGLQDRRCVASGQIVMPGWTGCW